MAGKREKPEEIVSKLRQVEVLQGQGATIAERPNHVRSYDFIQDRTADGRVYRTLNIIDEYTRDWAFFRRGCCRYE